MTFIYIIFGLTLIIFIHELGHFLAARWVGVKVISFSIGIGPRLLTMYKDKQGTEYILSLIPLGGYVRMKGQEDLPTKNTYKKVMADDHYLAKSPWKRMIIILSGVIMNFVLAYFLIIIAYNIGVPFLSNKVGSIIPNSPAGVSGLQVGDEIININQTSIDSFEDIVNEVALTPRKEKLLITVVREQEKKMIVIKEGDDFNLSQPFRQIGISPYLIPSVANLDKRSQLFENGLKNGNEIKKIVLQENGMSKTTLVGISELIKKNPNKEVTFIFKNNQNNIKTINNILIKKKTTKEKGFFFSPKVKVIKNLPAAKAGLQDGDVIRKMGEKKIVGWVDIISALEEGNFTQEKNFSIPVTITRNKQEITYNIIPIFNQSQEKYFMGITPFEKNNTRKVSQISPKMAKIIPGIRVNDQILSLSTQGPLKQVNLIRNGNEINFSYDNSTLKNQEVGYLFDLKDKGKVIRYELFEAFTQAFSLAYKDFKASVVFLKRLFSQDVPLEVLGGPIAIFETSYVVHQVKGWAYFILLFAKISISIAILNLLPIPALDGGHAIFTLYEIIRKKPVPENIMKTMHLAGFLLLVFLMIYVNYNDIVRLINR